MFSEEDVYEELTQGLRKKPDPVIWEHLTRKRWPADVVEGGASIEELVSEYRDLEKLRGEAPRPTTGRQERSTVPDPSLHVLADIQAIEAASLPELQVFRETVLGSRLVTPDEAREWVQKKRVTEGAPFFSLIETPDCLSAPRARATAVESLLTLRAHARYALGEEEDWPRARYGPGAGAHEADRELDFLYCLVDCLCDEYGWSNRPADDVVRFILTGQAPRLLPQLQALYDPRESFPAASAIFMRVNPRLSPREVMQFYSDFRQEVIGKGRRHRPISPERSALALFAARHNDGRSWEDVRQAWNKENGAGKYEDAWSFSRDCREAYRRVSGDELHWKNGNGSSKEDTE